MKRREVTQVYLDLMLDRERIATGAGLTPGNGRKRRGADADQAQDELTARFSTEGIDISTDSGAPEPGSEES